MTKDEVQLFLQKHPEWNHRRYQYKVIAAMTGITEEQAEQVQTISRRLRDLLPNDVKGATLEREWRASRGMETVSEMSQEAILGVRVVTVNGQKYIIK